MAKKLLDFTGTKISDVKQINPLFSTCKVRVLYTGKNRNMSIISKDAVNKALPTIIGVPIVGEFVMESKDFKGHGGAIDLDSYDFIHTTKPYGFVPQDAVFSWEEVKSRDGSIREYLVVDGCHLWTGRYPEVFSVVEQGKGQSMEIEVNDGEWSDSDEAYNVKDFTFSALCILGDDVEPAFEDANISTSFSLDSDSFKLEYSNMMKDFKESLTKKEEEEDIMLKELLEKYSTTIEDLTAKGLDFNDISEDEIEAKIIEILEVKPEEEAQAQAEKEEAEKAEADAQAQAQAEKVEADAQAEKADFEVIQKELEELKVQLSTQNTELETLREFKLNTEKVEHENKVQKLFSNFQLTEADVKDLDINAFSVEEIEEKCYAILGRKLATKKDFSLNNQEGNIKVSVNGNKDEETPSDDGYGGLFNKFKEQ